MYKTSSLTSCSPPKSNYGKFALVNQLPLFRKLDGQYVILGFLYSIKPIHFFKCGSEPLHDYISVYYENGSLLSRKQYFIK